MISTTVSKICTIVLKAPTKRLTLKEKEAEEDRKIKKKEKAAARKNKKSKKGGKYDDDEEEEDDSESEDEMPPTATGFSQFTQLSQSTQPFDDEEEVEVSEVVVYF